MNSFVILSTSGSNFACLTFKEKYQSIKCIEATMNVYFVQISTWNKYGNRFKLVGYGMLILWKPDPVVTNYLPHLSHYTFRNNKILAISTRKIILYCNWFLDNRVYFIKIVNVIKFQDTCNKLLSWTRYRYIYYVDYVYLIDNVVHVSLNMFNNGSSSGVKYLLMIR